MKIKYLRRIAHNKENRENTAAVPIYNKNAPRRINEKNMGSRRKRRRIRSRKIYLQQIGKFSMNKKKNSGRNEKFGEK